MLFDKSNQVLTGNLQKNHCLANHHEEDQDVIDIEESQLLSVRREGLGHRNKCIINSNQEIALIISISFVFIYLGIAYDQNDVVH